MDTMAAIRETFFQECEEQLGELEVGLNAMEEGVADSETVNAVFRAVHSIKGGAGAFKLDRLVRFAHTFETSLDLIRADQLAPSPTVMRTMLRSADLLADLVKASRSDHPVDEARVEAQIAELKALSESAKEAPTAANAGGGEADGLDFQPLLLDDRRSRRARAAGGCATPSNSSPRPTSIARATRRSVCCANCRAWANSASNATRGTCRRSTPSTPKAPISPGASS